MMTGGGGEFQQRAAVRVSALVDVGDVWQTDTEQVGVAELDDVAESVDARYAAGGEEGRAHFERHLASLWVDEAKAIAEGDLEWGAVEDLRCVSADVVHLGDIEVDISTVSYCFGGCVRAVVPDCPEERVHRGGSAGEHWGQKGVQLTAAPGQREEVMRVVAAVAGRAFGNKPGDTQDDLVRDIEEQHGGVVKDCGRWREVCVGEEQIEWRCCFTPHLGA